MCSLSSLTGRMLPCPICRSHITEWGWKDEWWTARRELRLTVRAECHYRSVSGSTLYLLLSCGVTIHAHQYLRRKSVCGNDIISKSSNKSCSCMPAERWCLRLAWDSWEVYMRMKHRMQESALQFQKLTALW